MHQDTHNSYTIQ